MKFKCTKDGNHLHEDMGIWEVKITPKIITFIPLESDERIFRCRKDNQSQDGLKDWGDGTYTVYPSRSGLPFYFEPV